MKIVIATPLYPPEIAEPALYIKELAHRLCEKHDVQVIAYTKQKQVETCPQVIPVDKRAPLIIRLFNFTGALWKASKAADYIFAESALASAIPAMAIGYVRRIPVMLHVREDEIGNRIQRRQLKDALGFKLRCMYLGQRWIMHRAQVCVFPHQILAHDIQQKHGLTPSQMQIILNPASKKPLLPFPIEKKPHDILVANEELTEAEFKLIMQAIERLSSSIADIRCVPLQGMAQAEMWYALQSAGAVLIPKIKGDVEITNAYAAGIPLIAVNSPIVTEAVKDGVSGVVIAELRADLIERAIVSVCTDEMLRNTLQDGAKQELQKYTWENHLAKLNRLFSI